MYVYSDYNHKHVFTYIDSSPPTNRMYIDQTMTITRDMG